MYTDLAVLVTGGTRGIGRAIVELFVAKGFVVYFTGTNKIKVDEAEKELKSKAKGFVCDVNNMNDIKNVITNIPKLDILVNNAGVFKMDSFVESQNSVLNELLNTNVIGACNVAQMAYPLLLKSKRGHVFMMCSVAGKMAYNNGFSYSISKFALDGMAKGMRKELASQNIMVTTVYPGATLTDSWAGVDLPKERFSQPNDIAMAIFQAYEVNLFSCVEEIVIRPKLGDI